VQAATFVLQENADTPFTNVGSGARPFCFDTDRDGDYDCLVGLADGTIKYLENTGSATVAEYTNIVDTLANPISGIAVGTYASPACVDIDVSCLSLSKCTGHGTCVHPNTCVCYAGWGGPSDIAVYKAPDCSGRVCPSGDGACSSVLVHTCALLLGHLYLPCWGRSCAHLL
jgi:hypothetical protein